MRRRSHTTDVALQPDRTVHAQPGRLHRRPCPVRLLPPVHRSAAWPPGPGCRPALLTADFAEPDRWWIVGADDPAAPGVEPLRAGPGRQPRRAERDPRRRARRRPTSRPAVRRAARRRPPGSGRRAHPGAAGRRRPGPPAGRDAAGVPGGPYDRPGDVDAHTGQPEAARRHHPRSRRPPPRPRGPEFPAPVADPVDPRRREHEQQHPQPGPQRGQGPGPGQRTYPPCARVRLKESAVGPALRDGERSRRAACRDATGRQAPQPLDSGQAAGTDHIKGEDPHD